MSGPLKSVRVSAARIRAIKRARLAIEEAGGKPPSIQDFVEQAIEALLRARYPEALSSPGRGRPRKTPRQD